MANTKQQAAHVLWPQIIAKRESLEPSLCATQWVNRAAFYECVFVRYRSPQDRHCVLLITNKSACPKPKYVDEKNYLYLPRDVQREWQF